MATIKDFYLGARPKTLNAAIAPVLLGGSLGIYEIYNSFECSGGPLVNCQSRSQYVDSVFSLSVLLACFIVSFGMQIGVNYANDYSDGIKGTDKNRVGPMRLVGSGTATPRSVFMAMLISFSVSAIAGIYVASQTTWWFVLVGAGCVALAWFYTGSKHPYGYYGFGELAVFITFGLVATTGTFFAVSGEITAQSIVLGCIPGMYSVAILLANNIRDIDTDRLAGKKTLAARVGPQNACHIFTASFVFVAISIVILAWPINLVWFAFIPHGIGLLLVRRMYSAKTPPEFISVLVGTSKLNLFSSIVISVTILASIQ